MSLKDEGKVRHQDSSPWGSWNETLIKSRHGGWQCDCCDPCESGFFSSGIESLKIGSLLLFPLKLSSKPSKLLLCDCELGKLHRMHLFRDKLRTRAIQDTVFHFYAHRNRDSEVPIFSWIDWSQDDAVWANNPKEVVWTGWLTRWRAFPEVQITDEELRILSQWQAVHRQWYF